MQPSQLKKLALLALIVGGAFAALKFGWIDQSTFDQLLTGKQPTQERQAEPKVRLPEVSSPQNSSVSSTNSSASFRLPEDTGSICASDSTISGPQDKALYDFARGLGLSYPETFVRVSNHINQTGRLPDCYMRKREARDLGWSGGPLWGYAQGRAIGGDRFGNREGRLPSNYNGKYIEADLDYDGCRRGADRLLFVQNSSGKWLQWVTVNHYDSFNRVPRPN